MLEAVLKNRREPAYTNYARKNQAGFKPGRGCRDQIFSIRQIIEQREEYKRMTHLIFIDFKAAFDSVHRECIWNICKALGLDSGLIDILRAMYTETYCQVRAYNSITDKFSILSEVRQGSVLSPFLINLAIDGVMKRTLEGDKLGIILDDMIIADLEFADHICLLEENEKDAQRLLDKVTQISAYVGLQINDQKTKFCSNNPNAKFTVKNEFLERVDALH